MRAVVGKQGGRLIAAPTGTPQSRRLRETRRDSSPFRGAYKEGDLYGIL